MERNGSGRRQHLSVRLARYEPATKEESNSREALRLFQVCTYFRSRLSCMWSRWKLIQPWQLARFRPGGHDPRQRTKHEGCTPCCQASLRLSYDIQWTFEDEDEISQMDDGEHQLTLKRKGWNAIYVVQHRYFPALSWSNPIGERLWQNSVHVFVQQHGECQGGNGGQVY